MELREDGWLSLPRLGNHPYIFIVIKSLLFTKRPYFLSYLQTSHGREKFYPTMLPLKMVHISLPCPA